MTEPEVLDGEPVIDTPPQPAPAPEPVAQSSSMALAPRERRHEVVRPLDVDQLVESFKAYQELLPRLLTKSDYQAAGDKEFVKKSGWRKVATAFDLDVVRISENVERDEHGKPVRAEAVYRAISPSGRVMDGDGYCSVDEERFGKPGDSEWKLAKMRAKLEHDLRSTAVTRAKNRAISDLVGGGEVSAEEVMHADETHGPAFGEALPKEHSPRVGQAIFTLLEVPDADPPDVEAMVKQIMDDCGGYFPAIVAKALLRVDAELMKRTGEA